LRAQNKNIVIALYNNAPTAGGDVREEIAMSEAAGLVHPSLYATGKDGSLSLYGVYCSACGRSAFPYQQYGCEACGAEADALERLSLPARGSIVSFSAVHRHPGKDIEAPFVIAQVRLDSGIFLRCTMASGDDAGLKSGQRVAGCLIAGSGPHEGKQELRFRQENT
jgi:uncharacterized protein